MPTKRRKGVVRESTNVINPYIEEYLFPVKYEKKDGITVNTYTKPKADLRATLAGMRTPQRDPALAENWRAYDRMQQSTERYNEARYKEANKYIIPYIPEKEIRLTTGRYNTGRISTNILDSIYDAAKRTGVPVDIALGLAGRESTFGIGRGFKRGHSITGTNLMSNWQQIQPYILPQSVIEGYNTAIKKFNTKTPLSTEEADAIIKYWDANDKAVNSTRPLTENPIDNALKFYMTGGYNPGDDRHTKMVEEDARIVMSDPAIQKWYQSRVANEKKCGGRHKAQLGLDIREGGIAIPIAKNMYYMQGRSHETGGIGIGPNNKNGLEVEGGEVVKVGKDNIRVFSSVPFLRGASPAQLVMGGANPNTVFKAQENFKDRNRINDDGTKYRKGGKKPLLDNNYSIMEYGGNMFYTINGNVKNGLMSLRHKARFGDEEKDKELYLGELDQVEVVGEKPKNKPKDKPKDEGSGTTPPVEERWVGQYRPTTVGDWIGLGGNLIGSLASYIGTRNMINDIPMPQKPVAAPIMKLKTRFNINAPLTEINEQEQMQRDMIGRNTSSSNVSLARQQRVMNEAQRSRNQLYTQKENIETQLTNQDRLNRQTMMSKNVDAYNQWLNNFIQSKSSKAALKADNFNNLISGLTGGIGDMLSRIESRRATNNTIQAIAAANPNVDARQIGNFDYYNVYDKKTGKFIRKTKRIE